MEKVTFYVSQAFMEQAKGHTIEIISFAEVSAREWCGRSGFVIHRLFLTCTSVGVVCVCCKCLCVGMSQNIDFQCETDTAERNQSISEYFFCFVFQDKSYCSTIWRSFLWSW